MPIAQTFEAEDQIPEWLRPACKEVDGKWTFEAETADEVRGLKSTLEKKKDDERRLKASYEERLKKIPADFDPERWEQIKLDEQKREEAEQVKRGEFEQITKKRLDDAKAKYDATIAERDAQIAAANAELDTLKIDGEVARLALEAGFDELLIEDVQARARKVFKRIDGVVTALKGNGEPIPSEKDFSKNLSISEWLASLAVKVPSFQKESKGTGAQSRSASGTPARKKPSEMSQPEKDAYIAENGDQAWKDLLLAERRSRQLKVVA